MSENGARRRPRVLSPETKWEIFLQVTSREITQADAGPQVAGRCVHDHRHPPHGERRRAGGVVGQGGPAGGGGGTGSWRRPDASSAQLSEAIKAQAIELALLGGKAGWA